MTTGRPLRVMLATDGSECADVARDLVGALDWPPESVVRVVTAVQGVGAMFGVPWAIPSAAPMERYEAELANHAESVVEATGGGLAGSGLAVERAVLRGRAGSVVPMEAAEWGADLIVMGSRGHGSIATMLLGSVSAEVVDHAPCPVLIGRAPRITRVVLAHDGSAHARAAEELVAGWSIFAGCAVEVTSVVQVPLGWYAGFGAHMTGDASELYRRGATEAMRDYEQIAGDAAQRLSAAGRQASTNVVEGNPAAEIIRVAQDRQADLIVVGTHGRTGLGRLVLGSVARNVLTHAQVSVLVVRPHARSSV
jgi:nucleotide-binding universal stress UspA family protein